MVEADMNSFQGLLRQLEQHHAKEARGSWEWGLRSVRRCEEGRHESLVDVFLAG